MITSVSCVTDKVTRKTTKRIIAITREKRACRTRNTSSVLSCPKIHWSLQSKTVPSSGDQLDKHSSIGTKLGCVAPNRRELVMRQ